MENNQKSDINLEYNFLGKSSLKVSNICLGTSTFGPQQHEYGTRPSCDDATAIQLLNRYFECGGNFIDTSDMYSHGDSEKLIGQWMCTQERDRIVLSTKVGSPIDRSNPNCVGLGRKHVCSSIEKSLRNLQTDYVDQYMIHYWDKGTSLKETLRTFNDLVRVGKVRHVGVCNLMGHQLQKCIDYCEFMGLEGAVNHQAEYSLLVRDLEYEVIEVCREEGVSLTPWGVLKGGFLTDKIKRNEAPPVDCRVGWATKNNVGGITSPQHGRYADDERYWRIMASLREIAKQTNKTVSQVATKWCLQKDVVPAVVVGVRTAEQLEDALGAGGPWTLTQKQMDELDEVSAPVILDTYQTSRRRYDRARTPCK